MYILFCSQLWLTPVQQRLSRLSFSSRSTRWPTHLLETHPFSETHCLTPKRRKRFPIYVVFFFFTVAWLKTLLLTYLFPLAPEAHKSSCSESPDNPYSVQTDTSSCHTRASQSSVLLGLLQITALWWTWWWWTLSHQWSLYASVRPDFQKNLCYICWKCCYGVFNLSVPVCMMFYFRKSIKKLVLKNLNNSSLYNSSVNREADDLASPSEYPQNGLRLVFFTYSLV